MMTIESLYKELGTIRWVGADEGWDKAIEAVRNRIAKELLQETIMKSQETITSSSLQKTISVHDNFDYTSKSILKDTCKKYDKQSVYKSSSEKSMCLFDNFDWTQNPILGLVCTCPKCACR